MPILREMWGGAAAGEGGPSRRSERAVAKLWEVSIQTPDWEKGWVDIPQLAADLVLPTAPFSQDVARFYFELTHSLRVLVRQLVAGADVLFDGQVTLFLQLLLALPFRGTSWLLGNA